MADFTRQKLNRFNSDNYGGGFLQTAIGYVTGSLRSTFDFPSPVDNLKNNKNIYGDMVTWVNGNRVQPNHKKSIKTFFGGAHKKRANATFSR